VSKLWVILAVTLSCIVVDAEPPARSGRDGGREANRGDRRTHRPGSHFKQAEIESLISKLCKEIATYRTSCAGIAEFSGFSRDLQNFDNTLSGLKSGLGRGFESCGPDLKRAIREYEILDQTFQSSLSTHKNYKVRLGWSKIKTAYLRFNFAATGGRSL
jgi:hypothetical protein